MLQADSLPTELSGKPLGSSKFPVTCLLPSKSFFEMFVWEFDIGFYILQCCSATEKETLPSVAVGTVGEGITLSEMLKTDRQILCVLTHAWLAQLVKTLPANADRHKRCGFTLRVGKISSSRKWQPTPVFLSEKFHGQRSLVRYNPWGHKESNTTERLSVHTHTQIVKWWLPGGWGKWVKAFKGYNFLAI